MEDNFTICPHCGTLNFKKRKYCHTCSFMLPLLGKQYENGKNVFFSQAIQRVLIIVLLLIAVAFTVKMINLTPPATAAETPPALTTANTE